MQLQHAQAEGHVASAGGRTVLGLDGWRFVFVSVALVSISIGVLTWAQGCDPNYTQGGITKISRGPVLSLLEVWRETKVVMSIPTFLLIILQVRQLFLALSLTLVNGRSLLHVTDCLCLFALWLSPFLPFAFFPGFPQSSIFMRVQLMSAVCQLDTLSMGDDFGHMQLYAREGLCANQVWLVPAATR